MQLIAITSPESVENEVFLIQEMLDRGVYRVHIRKPHWTPKKLLPFLESFQNEYRKKLVLHNLKRWPFTEIFGGVHLKGRDTDFSMKHNVSSLSRSCHSIAEVEKFRDKLDYMFLSPVFDSISKKGYQAAFSDRELEDAQLEKVFALGGVTQKNIPQVRKFGFRGAAVLGAVWESQNPIVEVEKILEAIDG